MNKTLQITQEFKTLTEAVAAAVANQSLDLSYNPAEAARKVKDCDSGYHRDRGVTAAFLTDNGVYYVYESGGMNLLHKFEPFISCLSDGGFHIAQIAPDRATIVISELVIKKTAEGRDFFRKYAADQFLAA